MVMQNSSHKKMDTTILIVLIGIATVLNTVLFGVLTFRKGNRDNDTKGVKDMASALAAAYEKIKDEASRKTESLTDRVHQMEIDRKDELVEELKEKVKHARKLESRLATIERAIALPNTGG